jgi:hypothetical protein
MRDKNACTQQYGSLCGTQRNQIFRIRTFLYAHAHESRFLMQLPFCRPQAGAQRAIYARKASRVTRMPPSNAHPKEKEGLETEVSRLNAENDMLKKRLYDSQDEVGDLHQPCVVPLAHVQTYWSLRRGADRDAQA